MFVAYPFASILYHAFTRWDGHQPAAVGRVCTTSVCSGTTRSSCNALRNNGIFALSVPIQLVLPLIVACVIHRRVPGWRFFRATVFLPAVYATVVIGILTATVLQLDGPLNQALGCDRPRRPEARMARQRRAPRSR